MTPPNLNLHLVIPECLIFAVLVILLIGEFIHFGSENSKKTFRNIVLGAGILAILVSIYSFFGQIGSAFDGMVLLDGFSSFFKIFFTLVALVILCISLTFFQVRQDNPAEFFLVLWSSLIGFFFLVSSNDFLLFFVSLEIITLSFYILTAYTKRELLSIESSIKYLILGSLASAFTIFGISLVYIHVGSTSFPMVRELYAANPEQPLMLLGIFMILAGVCFKVASVPFQLWVPDVYEGAPTPVVAFLSVGSKAAGFAILLKILFLVFPDFAEGRVLLFSVLAAMTLIYGNLAALVQTNIKRLFGYSSIGHAGYLLMGVAVGEVTGVSAVLYYLIAYAVTTLAVFYVITVVSNALKSDKIEAYRGLSQTSPFLAGILFVALLSSAGVPPLAGFAGKFFILSATVKGGLGWLALIGALGVAVSLYYYLSIVRAMYFEECLHEEVKIPVNGQAKTMMAILCVLIIVVGFFQNSFLQYAQTAAGYLF